ncbi:tetratricopeptide repeat protein [Alkalicoccus halolimnae]|uniref:Uncharacterized protein n=1 Tax=Alkalicoccus halolimnae TaxID=1667239 RepID=A0A5C7F6C8_9BACI|nr:hypothetical protein [Alkalicoccus halolimnae]TXF85120.1 hypothetical protein FTX54_09875 [Alkalicoccus halolimnae]
MEKQESLVQKMYYQHVIDEEHQQYPVKQLGKMLEEAQEDEALLSDIRFAQGEVYYHHLDVETAIFKWENVSGELKSWAYKNIGDAYYDLGWLDQAKDTYSGVQTEDTTLKSEIALQLLSIFAEEKNRDKVYEYLTLVLDIDPDYPGVSELARTLYEDYEDWLKAVDLSVKEAERTGDSGWYAHLLHYIRRGYTSGFQPEYFEKPARLLAQEDQPLFQEFIGELTARYRNSGHYLHWIAVMNTIFSSLELTKYPDWEMMAALHHDVYIDLTDGAYLQEEMEPLMPELLRNWEVLSSGRSTVLALAAQAAWEEVFPEKESVLNGLAQESGHNPALAAEEMLRLMESIVAWVEAEGLDPELTTEPLRQELLEVPGLSNVLEEKANNTFNRAQWIDSVGRDEAQADKTASRLSKAIRGMLTRLLEQQRSVENSLEESIHFNNEMLEQFKELHKTLEGTRTDKQKSIVESYQTMKQMQKEQFESNVPSIIKEAADVLDDTEKSAKNLHEELDVAINTRLRAYIDEDLFPVFRRSLQTWLKETEQDFQTSQNYFDEVNQNLNSAIGEETLNLQLDFELIHDWKRDLTRMINRTELPDENIMSRLEPKQMLLRNVGKFFGEMQQSKTFVQQQYRRYLESGDFQGIAEVLSYKLFFEFDLFDRAIRADVDTNYGDLVAHLEEIIETYKHHLEMTKQELANLQQNPEQFYDPLKIFDMRQKQCDRLLGSNIEAS